jgi:hypothetical protein
MGEFNYMFIKSRDKTELLYDKHDIKYNNKRLKVVFNPNQEPNDVAAGEEDKSQTAWDQPPPDEILLSQAEIQRN